MAHTQHTPTLDSLEEAIIVLFCLVDDALLNPNSHSYESLKRLSDAEVITLWRSSNSSGACRASVPSCAI